MINKKKYALAILLWCGVIAVQAQTKERFTYAVKETDTLWMDHYAPARSNGMSIIFVHGGGFTAGSPDNERAFAKGMTDRGYTVFVIKYRLYLKGRNFGCDMALPEKLKAIRLAVEDARDATKYIIDHAGALKVDTAKLFIGGSSAGAEAILNLVYNPFRKKNDPAYAFYDHFRYAGALSFAGAVIDINTIPEHTQMPLLMMHGTKDPLVPYKTASHHFCSVESAGWLMLFGSRTVYDLLVSRHCPVVLYTYEGHGHEVAGYMASKLDEIDAFMKEATSGQILREADIWVKQ